jgi:hypothetical protein
MSEAQQQTITPERQIAAQQVGAVFNSLHEYLRSLEPKDAEGRSTLTQQLTFAHCRVDEAAMWAIKSVLTYGIPPKPPKPAPPAAVPDQPAADSQSAAANDAPAAETPAPIGEVDPPQSLPETAAPAEVVADAPTASN